jgi:hypothetical protein
MRWMRRSTAETPDSCGIVAGAMLPTVLWIAGATRPGYSLWHHGASQLGLGERAGLQTVSFVLGGILVVGFSIGVRRVLQSGRGANWARPCLRPRASGSSSRYRADQSRPRVSAG